MKVHFKTKKLKKLLEDCSALTKKYGKENALKIVQRINELESSPSLSDLPPTAKTHPLSNNRNGQYAIHIKHPYRIILEPKGDSKKPEDILEIEIIEIIDYH